MLQHLKGYQRSITLIKTIEETKMHKKTTTEREDWTVTRSLCRL